MNVGHPVRRHRPPTRDEINLARGTRIKLQNAYIPETATVKVARELPPGRLSARSLQQRTAQRSAGMQPTVPPFTYTDRVRTTTPPLKVGIVQDVSGSQAGAAAAAVSGAWALANAATQIPDAKVAMVTFGNAVHCIIKPQTKVEQVPVVNANAGTEYFLESLKALEGELELMRPGAARLVVILTDGQLSFEDLHGRDAALYRLTQAGVKVLWMVTDGGSRHTPKKMPGLHIFTQASGNYSVIPNVICHEAVAALKK
jgi:Mg-chelatase subunit ChlD